MPTAQLWRTGQRIGDWHELHGCHGLLGLRKADVDERAATVLVRLKGARDEHRVPVTEDFWPLWRRYLVEERCWAETPAAWVGMRRGKGKPLTYVAFESALRYLGARLDVNVNAHMFRHALAQALVETSGLKVAQEVLGHPHIATTADRYCHVDQQAMVYDVKRFYGSSAVPACDHWDTHEHRPGPRALHLLQAMKHPSAIGVQTIRSHIGDLSEAAAARQADAPSAPAP